VGSTVILRFNQIVPPFNDVRVRQAVLLATDQRDYMAAFAGDPQFWQTCGSMFYCGTPYGVVAGPFHLGGEPQLDRARALLREAGYAGAPVVILQPGDHVMSPLALVAADNLKRIGMNATVRTVDYSTMMQLRASRNPATEGGWSIFFTRWEGALQNPSIFSPIGAACDKAWFGWPCDAEIERLRTAWAHAADSATRATLVEALVARAAEQVPFVNLGQVTTPAAWRSSLIGVPTTPTMIYWTIGKP
jgi:peptide/nickel transport system substrate-binding protein